MDNEALRKIAYELGFARAYFLPLPDFAYHDDEPNIVWNAEGYPEARCTLLLVWAYKPYRPDERIPSYYINSNLSYHASVSLARILEAEGVWCLRREVPVKQLAVKYGVALPLKSSLVAIPPFGTRMAFQTLLLGEPFHPEEYSCEGQSFCAVCHACENACPAHAISESGYDLNRCMRHYMDGADYPDWVYGIQRTHVGCEVCQQVCPHNAGLDFDQPTAKMRAAFDLELLASGDTKAARLLVGKNITGHGKLQKEAQHFIERGSEKKP